MRINKPLLLTCVIVTANSLLAQTDSLPEFPSMRECRPQVSFDIDQNPDGRFLFSYNVSNLPGAIQSINMFLVQIRTEGFSSDAPKDWYSSNIKREHIWAATWAPSDTGLNIESGKSLNGFKILSKALPSLVNFYAHGEIALSPSEIEFRKGTNDIFYNSFIGESVGPADPPLPFIHIVFLDTLLSYTRQSSELGWLGKDRDNDCDNDENPKDGIVRNIEQRLGKAKKILERRDSVLARRELEKLVDKVERLWKRSQDEDKKDKRDRWAKREKVVMTSEAYALLKYNTEYLIDRLPDRKPKKGSKDKD